MRVFRSNARFAVRTLAAAGALALRAFSAGAVEHSFEGLLDLRLFATDSDRVWLDEGLDKGRFGGSDEPLQLGAAILDYSAHWSSIVTTRLVVASYDGTDEPIDLTQAYLEIRPLPRSAWRWQGRIGFFYPPASLENGGVGWTSPYTLSFSAIDAWLAEEIRVVGGEAALDRMGKFSGSANDFGATFGVVRANDPAGALIAWRGWAVGDRQTGFFERLPLAELPAFAETGSFPPQEAYEEPFVELDHRTGGYAELHWSRLGRARVAALRYDNRGDPGVVGGGQWAWRTTFDHLAAQVRLGRGIDLLAQAMDGETRMDGWFGPLVLARFRAVYVLATGSFGRSRASLRFDRFEVDDRDTTPDDPNDESGHAWTAAWFYEPGGEGRLARWRFGAELVAVDSERPARELFGEESHRSETTLQLAVQRSF